MRKYPTHNMHSPYLVSKLLIRDCQISIATFLVCHKYVYGPPVCLSIYFHVYSFIWLRLVKDSETHIVGKFISGLYRRERGTTPFCPCKTFLERHFIWTARVWRRHITINKPWTVVNHTLLIINHFDIDNINQFNLFKNYSSVYIEQLMLIINKNIYVSTRRRRAVIRWLLEY